MTEGTTNDVRAVAITAAALFVALLIAVLFLPYQGHAQVPSVTLDWTATGDDGNVGTAALYEIRTSTARPDTTSTAALDSWWAQATVVTGVPAPLPAGQRMTATVAVPGGFTTGLTYYFVVRARDEANNWSGYSNVAVKPLPDTTPPSRIIDLIAR